MSVPDYIIEGWQEKPTETDEKAVADFITQLKTKSIEALDLPFVKNYLKVEQTEDDLFIALCIEASKSFLQNYLNRKFTDFDPVPFEFSIAALNLITTWYDNRGVNGQAGNNVGEAVYTFRNLVDPHRFVQFTAVGGSASLTTANFPMSPHDVIKETGGEVNG